MSTAPDDDASESWREEKQSAWLYRVLKAVEPEGSTRSRLFGRLADEAEQQAEVWADRARAGGAPVVPFRPSLRARLVAALVRRLGVRPLRQMLASLKVRGLSLYGPSQDAGHVMPEVVADVGVSHRSVGGGNLRAAVFGVNDGLISNTSLVFGIAGASRDAAWPIEVDPLAPSPSWTAEDDQAAAMFGASVSSAGDLNGDGHTDVIVGANQFDSGQTDEGRAFVYHGSATGLSVTPDWTAESDQASAGFGIGVGTAGDVNGDGYADVIVGAWFFDNGQADEGRAFVIHGSTTGLSMTPGWTAESNQAGAAFGFSVGTAGDVNGDGYADVIVGAYGYDAGETDEGRPGHHE